MHDDSRRAIFAAFAANVAIAILKFIGFVVTGSAGMFAEGVHSLADTGNQGLLLLGGRRASRSADSQHPFGYGRERYFWSFVVALVLFSVGGLFAIFEAVEKLIHPHSPESLGIAVAILVGAVILESFSLVTAVREANPLRGEQSWWSFLRSSRTADLPVLLLEDSAALCGLALALAGVILAAITGDGRWDAVGSLAIGLLLIGVATFLAIKMKRLLIGESATPETKEAIISGHQRIANRGTRSSTCGPSISDLTTSSWRPRSSSSPGSTSRSWRPPSTASRLPSAPRFPRSI